MLCVHYCLQFVDLKKYAATMKHSVAVRADDGDIGLIINFPNAEPCRSSHGNLVVGLDKAPSMLAVERSKVETG